MKQSKTIAIIQSSYIPWKGYFDIINHADEFILLDDVQYTKRDWRNRNRIKTPQGLKWLSIPVKTKDKYTQKIKDTQISDPGWGLKHWETIQHFYRTAPYFKQYHNRFEDAYLNCTHQYLSRINYRFICLINEILGIDTPLFWSDSDPGIADPNHRLIDICLKRKATQYLSGPSARQYINIRAFENRNVHIKWMDYSKYREYDQLYPPFSHFVTILDLIFSKGPDAKKFMNSFKGQVILS